MDAHAWIRITIFRDFRLLQSSRLDNAEAAQRRCKLSSLAIEFPILSVYTKLTDDMLCKEYAIIIPAVAL